MSSRAFSETQEVVMSPLWKPGWILTAALLLAGCAAYQAQHGPRTAPTQSPADITAPVAERSVRQAPTQENRRVVDEFARASGDAKQATLLSQLEIYKQELAEQGKYDCCVRPGCNECVLNRGECQCRKGVEKGGPCCGECTAAWIEGRGDVPGIDKEEILKNLGCYRELYEGGPQGDAGSSSDSSGHQHHH